VQCDAPTDESWATAMPNIRLVGTETIFSPAIEVENLPWQYFEDGQCDTGSAECEGEWSTPVMMFESKHCKRSVAG